MISHRGLSRIVCLLTMWPSLYYKIYIYSIGVATLLLRRQKVREGISCAYIVHVYVYIYLHCHQKWLFYQNRSSWWRNQSMCLKERLEHVSFHQLNPSCSNLPHSMLSPCHDRNCSCFLLSMSIHCFKIQY